MKIVVISECKPREMIVVDQIIQHFPSTTIIQPTFSKNKKNNTKLTNLVPYWGKKTLAKIHGKLLEKGLFPDNSFPKINNLISIPVLEINRESGIKKIKSLDPDILITCRAPLLKPEVIGIPKIAAINVHYGLAPHYRGNDTLFWPLFYNDYDKLGGCIHYLTQGVDTGNILAEVFPALDRGNGELDMDIGTTRLLASATKKILQFIENGKSLPEGKPQTVEGKNFRFKDRTFGKSLQFLIKKNLGLSKLPSRNAKIVTYF